MPLPIRARLTLTWAALMAMVFLAAGAFLYFRLKAELLATVDAGLRSRAENLLVTAASADPLGEAASLVEADDAFAQVLDPEGTVIDSSPGLAPAPLVPPASLAGLAMPAFFTAEVSTSEETVPEARLLAVPAGERVIVVGAALDDQREALSRLLALFAVAGPVALALTSGVGWLVAGAALRPVERMRVEAEAISASEPTRRLPVGENGDELARLAETLNRMLGRLQEALAAERRFTADASHELRTPLANLRTELELALRRSRTPEELEGSLRSAAEDTERLIRLAEDLLVLARAGGGLPVRLETTDLGRLIDGVLAGFQARATQQGLTLAGAADGDVSVSIDRQRMAQAVSNLVENALRHTPRGGTVTATARRGDGSVSVEVVDTGPGFPASFLAHAFEPFSRAGAARGRQDGGAGLGLAIVKAIAEAHGGTVEARNRPEGGASVVVRVPVRVGDR